MTYEDAREYLAMASKKGIILGLSVMEELLKKLGNPEKDLKIVHIAGTNGKGSILSYIEQILLAAGYHTGRYVSPAVGAYEERFLIDGIPVSKEQIPGWTEQVKQAADQMKEEGKPLPTVFEIETAMAFLCFREAGVSVVLLETGMGGRLDATNVIEKPLLSVIASVSMDHMAVLGKNLTEIAGEKAGIIKEGCETLLYPGNPEEVKEVVRKTCSEKHSRLTENGLEFLKILEEGMEGNRFSFGPYEDLFITLPGHHQILNAAVAVQAADILKQWYEIREEHIREGLKNTQWKARLQKISEKPMIYLDGAHNEDGAKQLRDFIVKQFQGRRILGVMGVLKDKEYDKIAAMILPLMEAVVTITPDNPRGLSGEKLMETALKYCRNVTKIDDVTEALSYMVEQAEEDDVIIVFGSLSFMGKLGGF